MLRNLMPWNRSGRTTRQERRRAARHSRRFRSAGDAKLGIEHLEARHVLSANPVLTVVADQFVNEASPLSITNLGTFTDVVEGSGPGGATIGLKPGDYASLGAFDPASNVVIDTTALTISGGFSATGTTVTANLGFGSFQIAVFAFSSFELDLGRTITATGSRPFALLSQGNMLIHGTIDASAPPISAGDQFVPGPGGGAGGDGIPPRHGDAAAGAPLLGGGQLGGGTNTSGSGGGFGGVGGTGEANGNPSGAGGIAYGNLALAIQGGSGGSAGAINSNGTTTTGTVMVGGGGGGGVELGALGSITISATGQILANGGQGRDPSSSANVNSRGGGGGAGGGILVHATDVFQTGVVSAKGGNGGVRSGAGGGGGRIMLVHSTTGSISQNLVNQVVTGGAVGTGAGTGDATPGAAGVVTTIAESPAAPPVIETFDYVIDWGDPSLDSTGPATIDVPGVNVGDTVQGSFDGSHTYADNGVYTVTVTINDNNGGTDTETFQVTVNNVAPTLAISGAATVNEGGSYTLGLSSSDPGTDTISQWTIDWGDSVQVVSGNPASVGHTYADGDTNYTISATATDEDGTFAAGNTIALTVLNVVPLLALAGAANVNEGSSYTLNLSSSDPGVDIISQWTIDWGDSVQVVSGNPASVGHTYADGDTNYTISATATDEDGTFNAGNTVAVTVHNVAPTLTISGASSVNEGTSYTLSLSSSDPGADTISQWTIDWGDGTEVILGSPSTVSHIYADGANNYTISATATDEDGTFAAGSTVAVTVANLAPLLILAGAATVNEGSSYTLNLSSSDPGTDTISQWTINWGDSVQIVSGNPSSATHTYADGTVSYTISATATDEDGTFAAGNTVALSVLNVVPLLALAGAASVNEGSTYALNLSASDPGADTISQWTINWGDSVQVVSGNPSSVTHTYADGTVSYSISATATDEDGTYTAGNTVVITVQNVAPTANAGGPYQTFDDTPITLHGTGTDPAGAFDPLAFSWDLDNNGSFETSGANPTFDPVALGFSGTITRTVQLRVSDGDGGVTTTTTTVQLLGQGTLLIDNVLYVVGNNSACDIVLITQCNSTIQVYATFNSSNPASFNAADVSEIQVRTRGGHDIVITTPNVTKLMTIDGGSGNDLLTGGGGRNLMIGGTGHDVLYGSAGDDVLLGGDGNDDLIGGSGNDVLVGGNGNDILRGGAGRDLIIGSQDNDLLDGGGDEDILIGGYTIHDNNVAALDAVMAIWGSGASFSSRVATLTATGGLLQAGVAVFDDDDGDILLGGAGRDLIFGDTSPVGDGVVDLISLQPLQDVLVAVN